jgi:hypothetical protein
MCPIPSGSDKRYGDDLYGDTRRFHVVSDEPAAHDVPIRTPDVREARGRSSGSWQRRRSTK